MGIMSRLQDSDKDNAVLARLRRMSPRLNIVYAGSIPIAIALAIICGILLTSILRAEAQTHEVGGAYQRCQAAVTQLQDASDFLTSEARQYVQTGERIHLDNYIAEVERYDRRGQALQTLQENAYDDDAIDALAKARKLSDELAETEVYALKLEAQTHGVEHLPTALDTKELAAADAALSDTQKHERASHLVEGTAYNEMKAQIRSQVNRCSLLLVDTIRSQMEDYNEQLSSLVFAMHVSVILLVVVIITVILATILFLIWPMATFEKRIRNDKPLEPQGARELRHLIDAYNSMYAHLHQRAEELDHEANHDALTGAYNRGAFEQLLNANKSDCALVLVDVDNFKEFNDTYGHDMGDAILIEVVATIFSYFRPNDYICRIGGDEFAVIMSSVGEGTCRAIEHKLVQIAAFLRDTTNGLPAATISVGIAFGRPGIKDDELFQEADTALYEAKRQGRDQYVFAKNLTK